MSKSTSDSPEQKISPIGPPDDSVLKINDPKEKAAGMPGVVAGLKEVGKYMKPMDGLRTSLKLNQKLGIDCPGCAWPDPDHERSSLTEYCENGLKAIAEEAQKKTINRSICELSKRSTERCRNGELIFRSGRNQDQTRNSHS